MDPRTCYDRYMYSSEEEFSLKTFIFPFTTRKAITWIIVIGCSVFFTMLFNGFVWDDLVFILNNPELHTVSLLTAFGQNYFNNSGYYRPLPELYFSILYTLFGQHAFFYHLTQLFLHIICTILLFFLYRKFFQKSVAFILALIFLVHPINVESVSYIAASQSELVFLFGVGALVLVQYKKYSLLDVFLVSCLLLFSLLTKEIFILLLFLYKFLFNREKITEYSLGLLSILGIYAWLRFGVAHVFFEKMGYAPISQLSFGDRLRTVPAIIFYYIKTVLFPWKLAIDQQWVVTTMTVQSFYLPLIFAGFFLGGITWFGIYLYKRERKRFKEYVFFLFLFICSMSILLQFFPLDMTVADRWFYVPCIGLLGLVGLLVQQCTSSVTKQKIYVIAAVIILLFSLRTVVRNSDWYSLLTLYRHDTAIEDSFDNENNYAVVLVQLGDINGALPHLLKANKIYPTEFSLRNTGMAYLGLHDEQNAKVYLEKALKTKSFVLPPHKHQTATYDSYARYYLITKDYTNAERIVEEGVKDYPDAYTLWYIKAIATYLIGDKKAALTAAEKAYSLYNSEETRSLYTALKNNLPFPVQISN
jgi:hypothetical protein